MARVVVVVPVLILVAALGVWAQVDTSALRARIEKRFEILPIADGVVLTPRFKTEIRSIQVSDNTIAVDGDPVTGAELLKRIGDDANAVMQLTYLDAEARQSLGRPPVPAAPAAPAPPPVSGVPPAVEPGAVPPPAPSARPRRVRRDDIVRIGGNVQVTTSDHVTGDVVAIGGNADIDGQVDGEVVVVGGSLLLGPNAVIHNDVVVVGGGVSRHPDAEVQGHLQEVGFEALFGPTWDPGETWARWNPMGAFYPFARFMGTMMRVGLLMLLAGLVILVARTPVEQIANRAAVEPIKSWAIGFLAEILFGPLLILTIVVLAVSIIGIPLLLLVPVAIVALMVVFLVGFTGVAYQVGRLLQERVDWLRTRPYPATIAGIAIILSPLLVARLLGLAGVGGFIAWILVAVGFVAEYVAWTTGLGAAALARFSRPAPVGTMMVPETRPTIANP